MNVKLSFTQQWTISHENFSLIVTQLTSQSNDNASQI